MCSARFPLPEADADKAQIAHERALLFDVDTSLHNRVNFMLVTESLFFAALSQVWGSDNTLFKLVLCATALMVTVLLLWPLASGERRSNFLANELRKSDSLYKAYSDVMRLGATKVLAYGLSGVFIVSWILVILIVLKVLG